MITIATLCGAINIWLVCTVADPQGHVVDLPRLEMTCCVGPLP